MLSCENLTDDSFLSACVLRVALPQVQQCQVVQVKTVAKDGYTALQVFFVFAIAWRLQRVSGHTAAVGKEWSLFVSTHSCTHR